MKQLKIELTRNFVLPCKSLTDYSKCWSMNMSRVLSLLHAENNVWLLLGGSFYFPFTDFLISTSFPRCTIPGGVAASLRAATDPPICPGIQENSGKQTNKWGERPQPARILASTSRIGLDSKHLWLPIQHLNLQNGQWYWKCEVGKNAQLTVSWCDRCLNWQVKMRPHK